MTGAAPLLDPKQAMYLAREVWGGSSITVVLENYIQTFLDSNGMTYMVVPSWATRCVLQLAQCSTNINNVDRQEPIIIERDVEDLPTSGTIRAIRGVTMNQFQARELKVEGVNRLVFFAGAEKFALSLEFYP